MAGVPILPLERGYFGSKEAVCLSRPSPGIVAGSVYVDRNHVILARKLEREPASLYQREALSVFVMHRIEDGIVAHLLTDFFRKIRNIYRADVDNWFCTAFVAVEWKLLVHLPLLMTC